MSIVPMTKAGIFRMKMTRLIRLKTAGMELVGRLLSKTCLLKSVVGLLFQLQRYKPLFCKWTTYLIVVKSP